MDGHFLFIFKFPRNGKIENNIQLLILMWPVAGGRDWDRRLSNLEDLVVMNTMMAVDWLDSRQFGRNTTLKWWLLWWFVVVLVGVWC